MYYYAVFREAKTYNLAIQRLIVTAELETDLDAHFHGLEKEWEHQERRPMPLDRDWVLKDGEEVWTAPFTFPKPYDAVFDNPLRYTAYHPPHDAKVLSMRALVAADHKARRLLFQQCNQSHTLGRRVFAIVFDRTTFTKLTQPGLSVNNSLCAIVADDTIEFLKTATVTQFIDLSFENYGEATVAEIQNVLGMSAVFSGSLDDTTVGKLCDKPTRKHFQKILKDGVMQHTAMTGEKLAQVCIDAGFDLEMKGRLGQRRIVLPTEKGKMKKLVLLLNQKIFRSVITDDFCETNSYRKLKKTS